MFTIKYCENFKETLYHSCDEVSADTNHASPGYGVRFRSEHYLHHHIGEEQPPTLPPQPPKGERGTVFVMNDLGKTVAKYDI